MENLILGFLTGGSLILAIGPQNLFVIEQGLKRNFVFTITTICAASDILLIFLGIFIYHIFDSISLEVEVILNIILIVFLINYIKDKTGSLKKEYKIKNIEGSQNFKNIILGPSFISFFFLITKLKFSAFFFYFFCLFNNFFKYKFI